MKRIFLPLSFVLVAFFSSFVFCQTPTKLAKLIEDDLKESRFEFRFGYSSPQQGLIHQNKVDYRFNMSRFYIGFEFLPSISFLYQDLLHHSGKSTFASMALYSVYYPYELEIGKTTFLTTNSKVTNMTYDETDGSIYDFREDYKYDDKGNLIQRTVLDQGTDTADIFYYSYDLYGRLINRTINLKQQGYQLIDTMEYDGNKVIRHVQGYLNSQGFTSSEYKYFYSGNFIVRCDYSTQK